MNLCNGETAKCIGCCSCSCFCLVAGCSLKKGKREKAVYFPLCNIFDCTFIFCGSVGDLQQCNLFISVTVKKSQAKIRRVRTSTVLQHNTEALSPISFFGASCAHCSLLAFVWNEAGEKNTTRGYKINQTN